MLTLRPRSDGVNNSIAPRWRYLLQRHPLPCAPPPPHPRSCSPVGLTLRHYRTRRASTPPRASPDVQYRPTRPIVHPLTSNAHDHTAHFIPGEPCRLGDRPAPHLPRCRRPESRLRPACRQPVLRYHAGWRDHRHVIGVPAPARYPPASASAASAGTRRAADVDAACAEFPRSA